MPQTTIKKTIQTTPDDAGKRLDVFLSEAETALTRSHLQKLIENGFVLVRGVSVSKNYKLRGDESVEIEYPAPEPSRAEAEDIALDVVYEDEDIIVINKPKGMVVHPAAGNPNGTLVNALLHHCGGTLSGIGGVIRPGIVHRIDKDTSGLLVAAKNDTAHLALSEQLKSHDISRVYYALALGTLRENRTVDLPIGRHPTDRKKMAVTEKNSKNAITHIEILENFPSLTHVRCILETGRTHQIRVHLSHIGHPLLGDTVYGSAKHPMNKKYGALTAGQALHAGELTLTHPRTSEIMHFSCTLPAYFAHLLEILKQNENS